MTTKPIASFDGVTKRFGSLTAVDDVSLDIRGGEVLALLGENGAGKSTLMKLLYGLLHPDLGAITVAGRDEQIANPIEAMRAGIGMVFQHFSLAPAMTVRENLLLAWPKTPIWTGRGNPALAEPMAILERLAPGVDPETRIGDLAVSEQQLVELAKVLNLNARLVILDEPSSVLAPAEVDRLHRFVRGLAHDGVGVILITHKMKDVEACADRIAVMRQGKLVDVFGQGERTVDEIVRLMMGTDANRRLKSPPRPTNRATRLHLHNVRAQSATRRLQGITLSVAAGEIVGVAGVAGNGQTLLAETVAGIHRIDDGDVVLDGVSVARRTTRESFATPLGYVPEQPRDNAVVTTMDAGTNLRLRELAAGTASDRERDRPLMARFGVQPDEPARPAGTFSGGNLQKLVCARELGRPRAAVLACYPTMGLDHNAVATIYRELFAQAAAGAAVLWISEDLDDLLAAAHRIAVLYEGRIAAIFDNADAPDRAAIGALMTGLETAA